MFRPGPPTPGQTNAPEMQSGMLATVRRLRVSSAAFESIQCADINTSILDTEDINYLVPMSVTPPELIFLPIRTGVLYSIGDYAYRLRTGSAAAAADSHRP